MINFDIFLVIITSISCPKPIYGFVNNYICTEDFCDNYREVTGCDPIKTACLAQNSTHNGVLLPSISPCSCCEICVENLKLGDDCSVGGLGSPIPPGICGPGLYCRAKIGEEHPTCQPMSTSSKCYSAQIKFDEKRQSGEIGHLMQRPVCDGDGNFSPVVCIPGQTCHCVDKEKGTRIFGESVFEENIHLFMKCECARLYANIPETVDSKYPFFSSRCDAMGSFDPLQCLDDICTCVDVNTGTPMSNFRNITRGLAELPCFNKQIHDNNTYMRECESIKWSHMMDIYELEEQGFNVVDFEADICDPDGGFFRIQEDDTSKFCANKDGSLIANFIVDKDAPDAHPMNCKCAKARQLLLENKRLEVPECCSNGNFPKFTCRRGECYCINEDGIQTSVEVFENKKSLLECYNDGNACFSI